MLDFVTYLSIRYTNFACVKAAFGHVIEFHFSFLRVSPPPLGFPRTRWFMQKLKLAMAKFVTGPVPRQVLGPEPSRNHPGHNYTFVAFKAIAQSYCFRK